MIRFVKMWALTLACGYGLRPGSPSFRRARQALARMGGEG
jgi:hypothetical protein